MNEFHRIFDLVAGLARAVAEPAPAPNADAARGRHAARFSPQPVEKLWRERRIGRFSTGLAVTAAACALLVGVEARAAESDPNAAPPRRTRRGGFTAGLALGPLGGAAVGYPNDLKQIGRPEFRSDTGFSGGGAGTAWIGVTFNDYLAFGLAGYGGAMVGAQHLTTFNAFAFRLEGYPAFGLGGPLRDFGLSLESGLGVATTKPVDSDAKVIESGAASRVALGTFFEGLRVGKFAMGPFAAVDLSWSPSSFRHTTWIGWRTNFNVGP
ncbi:MAG: hypothetical protein FJ095_16725 [Deltaproteobacteria bacterium]|nr:hypothetical protein [Deltaproteobacteria bacterium]